MDATRFLLGDVAVERAAARTFIGQRPASPGRDGAVDVDDWASAELVTSTGATITVEASRIALGAEGTFIELYGDAGSLVGDPSAGSLRLRRFDGHEAEFLAAAREDAFVHLVAELRPPPRLSLGSFGDLYAAGLHHFMLRVVGADPAPGLAPMIPDAAAAEAVVHRAIAVGGAS